ncbi:50S ribosomal protein L7/L12 [Acinetobacter junii]|uniref:ribosomal protein L7/L12 n=1 Tax=Acinetobacter junii TaxID=40215 RepID=UPI0009509F4C|nr:ribosomal protein L7/L12 [Acinetobacter junii]APU48312.1 50S ribosomal protein L7/L12 [Acinetobacter junii]TIE06923.1 50S ribosomal protein L7/L12 [Acinetobacter junii]
MTQMEELPQEALIALRSGKLIDAIKITREKTGLGLKESKDLVDRYLDTHPNEQIFIQEQLAQRSRSGIQFLVAVLFLIAMLVWFIFK